MVVQRFPNGYASVLFYFTPYAFDKKTPNFAQGLDFLRSQVAIYTVFHEESESEVEKCQILEPGGKNRKNLSRNSRV